RQREQLVPAEVEWPGHRTPDPEPPPREVHAGDRAEVEHRQLRGEDLAGRQAGRHRRRAGAGQARAEGEPCRRSERQARMAPRAARTAIPTSPAGPSAWYTGVLRKPATRVTKPATAASATWR